ncbi:MAG TPA: glutathione S-transferase [Nevskiaceae bacterium]|nr:glutathione S-transferase [Nevskiaceae bacterium]
MLTLYHAPQSRSTRFLWLLEELGADYKIAYTNIPRRDGSGAIDPANPHPDKKVPALVHDGVLVTESAAIALYLTDLHPKAQIGPQLGDPDRGPYLTWLAYYAGVVEPVVNFQFNNLGDHVGLRRTFRGREELEQRLLGTLSKSPYLLGEKFSAADILLVSLGQFARQMLPAGEVIDAYLKRCQSRPALARALAKDSPASRAQP